MNFKFSVSIITLNEEKNIDSCLKSVIDLTDDIIVVDSGSTDRTKEICEKYPVRFIYNKFVDYGTQKAFAASQSKYDFVLSIDADEMLSDKLIESIKNIKVLDEQNIAFSFNRLNFHCGKPVKHCGWYPDKKLRLWNKKFGNWQGSIHETIVFEKSPKIIHLEGDLYHFTYNSYFEHINQAMNFAVRNAEKDYVNGKRASLLKVLCSFWIKFVSIYLFKAGFLDGFTGFFISITGAYATFFKNVELYKKKNFF